MKGFVKLTLIGGIFLTLLLLLAPTAKAQLSGAYYWGDADANGVIEVPDMIALNTVLGNPASDDLLIYTGYPQSRYRQELDGNGVIEIPDLIVLNSWVPGDFSSRPGNPDRMALDADSVTVLIGSSVTTTAYALSPISQGSQVRTGFGIKWVQVGAQTTCASAEVYGYNTAGGATINAWRTAAYHYSIFPAIPDNGRASMKVRGNACTGGQRTTYEVYIPNDTEATVVPGRFPVKLNTATNLRVYWSGGAAKCNTISVLPGSTNLIEGNSTQLRAVCTLTDATTVNCTAACQAVTTNWACGGDVTCLATKGKISANQKACLAGGAGTATAQFGATSDATPTAVTVINNDTVNTITVTPNSGLERAVVPYRAVLNCNDGNTQNGTAESTVAPPAACTGGAGTATLLWVCGNDAPGLTCIVTSHAKTGNIVVNDAADTITGIVCSIVSATEQGSTATLGCLYSWSNGEGNCNDSTDNANVDATVTGANCQKSGQGGQCLSKECDGSNWTCTIGSAKTAVTDTYSCVDDSDTILNGSTILTPAGPISLPYSGTQVFGGLIRWSEACTLNTCPTASFSQSVPTCGTWTLATCTYAAKAAAPACTDRLTATYGVAPHNVSDGTTINVGGGPRPIIGNIFPLDFPARFKGNSHTDQGITLLFNYTVGGGALTDVHMTCTPAAGPLVVFTVANCPVAAYPDVLCTPPAAFLPLMNYSCTVTATNANGSTVLPAARTLRTATTVAPATPAVGGLGGGYVGGNAYSRTTGVSTGTLNIQLVDMDTRDNVAGKAYIQIVQGTTTTERFTNAAGLANITGVLPLPINAITAGLKCGTARCDLATKANNYRNYMYETWQTIDARDMVLRMKLMDNSSGFINTWSALRSGRYRADVFGTIPPAHLSTFIAPLDRASAPAPRLAIMFAKPSKLRAGLAIFSLRNIYEVPVLFDNLMASGDTETSLSLCMATDTRNGVRGLGMVTATALPQLLVAPELVRANWNLSCTIFSTNPGVYQFKVWNWVPRQTMPLMVIGAYANASNFSLSVLAGGLNLFVFPLYVGGVGYHTIAPLATWGTPGNPPTSDLVLHMGNLGFELDMRERWVSPDFQAPGYEPDAAVDKRITISVQPILPVDPARMNALQSADTTWFIAGRRVPNNSDQELTAKWAGTYGVGAATWDDRFLRNSAIVATGAFSGFTYGINIFGLQLNTKIDDTEFTSFEIGYLASAAQGLWGVRVGSSQWRYWSNSAVDTERFGREITFVPSNVAGEVTIPWSQPTEGGGSVNYAGLVALTRGLSISSPKVTPRRTDGTPSGENLGLHGVGQGTYNESGFSLRVVHVGPIQSYATTITANGQTTKAYFVERFLDAPEAISPSPDTYYYPAPQWNATYRASLPVNRNGELRRVFTYGALATKYAQRTGGTPNRKYLRFSVPGWTPASAADTPDMWLASVTTRGKGLSSAKSGVHDTDATATSTTLFTDLDARFLNQGVAVGSRIYMNKGAATFNTATVTAVTQTTFTASAAGPWPAGTQYIEYSIGRTTPVGECYADPWYGGDSFRRQGGGCKNITLWYMFGPVPAGATQVDAYIANITPGAATLNGVTGIIPDAWEGIPASTLWGANWYSPPSLHWTYGIININSDSTTLGGLGGPLDWNNQNFWLSEFSLIQFSTSEGEFLMNFGN